jgi:L-fucose isomerase-like protein
MKNAPQVKLGIVAVSRDCFPMSLSKRRREAVAAALHARNIPVTEVPTIVENEKHALQALSELNAAGCNALLVYLGNFGPEGPETLLAQRFNGPVMFAAAAEENGDDLLNSRGDAYCGLLNASYNLGLRGVNAHIPEIPVGTAEEVAAMAEDFLPAARVKIALGKLKIFAFGPRPFDFLACNAPIAPLYTLGVEIQENSELDLFAAFNARKGDPRIPQVAAEMAEELGRGNKHEGILPRLAQLEITLLDWAEENKGASEYFIFANKCWPAFQTQFGMVPCYVNSRLTARGIPVSCETDIYGALSEYILYLTTNDAPTLLDINNTVPADMYKANAAQVGAYKHTDLFMGFHCGNTPIKHLKEDAEMKHQLIMKRALEPDSEPDITRGTLEGTLKPGQVTLFRLQSTANGQLCSYIAQGETLDINHKSFGGIGVIGIPEMARFYRHVLIAKRYPHHAGMAFAHAGKALYNAMKLLNIQDIAYNRPASLPYPGENPF